MTRDEVSKISPEAQKYCTEIYDQAVQMGPYTPYGMVPEHFVPGVDGRRQQRRRRLRSGPRHGLRDRAQRRDDRPALGDALVRCAAVVRQDEDAVRLLPRSRGLSRATQPPWAELFGINANTGDIVWRVPLGEYKELTAKGIPKTGTATNTGAPLATAGGVVFIGGTVGRPVPRLRRDDRQGTVVGQPRLQRGAAIADQLQGRQRQAVRRDFRAAHDRVR